MSAKQLSESIIQEHCAAFWVSLTRQWDIIYRAVRYGTDSDRTNALGLLHFFAGPLDDFLDFEITFGEINRVVYSEADTRVELYISPRLLKTNLHIMNKLYSVQTTLPNLQVFKYRSYNVKDPLISVVEFPDVKYQYTDFGCQAFSGLSETKRPIINIVMFVRKQAAETLLKKREVSFVDPNKPDEPPIRLDKWLPSNSNAVDVLLVNIIGEYNLINNVGYIEFLPEGDPLIANGSVFTELSDLKDEFQLCDRVHAIQSCLTCGRRSYQAELKHCGRCSKALYCGKLCQRIDFSTHKLVCQAN